MIIKVKIKRKCDLWLKGFLTKDTFKDPIPEIRREFSLFFS